MSELLATIPTIKSEGFILRNLTVDDHKEICKS